MRRNSRGAMNSADGDGAADGDVLVIPDLEEGGADDFAHTVAAAPRNTARRVPSLRELDHAIRFTIPSAAEGLDMSMLTKTLVPPHVLQEPDSLWEFDTLLQEVTQAYNATRKQKLATATAPFAAAPAAAAALKAGDEVAGTAGPRVGGGRVRAHA
ncbi:intraflagellar transport protein 43-domain-containing protein [Tribonema minus]|uniref:Intraflagellar transport protein 43-domain-containing protein n=1 Tax=Tribonema minus TaxID=303371 RepID=A0A836CKA7_9STRA|nr:intraflagellar transport protein 43-domain-containing protein [Tribonema minus]